MSHPFHSYLSRNLADLLRKHAVVVFYDPRREFTPFVDEFRSRDRSASTGGVPQVELGDLSAGLVRYQGSFFAIRAQVEPLVAVDRPEPLLIYMPGVERDRKGSVLMELELAGECYEPQLKRLGPQCPPRAVHRRRHRRDAGPGATPVLGRCRPARPGIWRRGLPRSSG